MFMSNVTTNPKSIFDVVAKFTQVLFLISTVFILLFFYNEAWFKTLAITFGAIVLEAAPFMLVGALIGGFIETFVSKDFITSFFKKRGRFLPILVAALLGILLPVCECAIVFVIRRLLKKGVPLSAAVAYLLAGPIVNPIVILSTAIAYNFEIKVPLIRTLCGFVIAIIAGIVMELVFKNKKDALVTHLTDIDEDSCCHHHQCFDPLKKKTFIKKVIISLQHSADEFFDIGRFLIIGAFIAGLAQTVIARETFISVMGTPIVSIIIMMLMALALNLCSESDAFIAASFRNSSIPLSAQIAFMVLGPMLDIKLIIMYLKVFKYKAIIILSSLTFFLVLTIMCLLEYFIL